MNNKKNYSGCFVIYVLFIAILQAVFITLRLVGVIEWNWLWALSPLWLPCLLFVFGIGLVGIIIAIGNNRKGK